MTDEPMSPADDDPARPPLEPPAAPPAAATARPGRGRPLIAVGLLGAFLLLVVFTVKDNGAANDLKIGDCFDIPSATTVKTVTHHPCTEPHTAEVFHVAEYSGRDMNTPISLVLDEFVGTTCDPVFATYVGKALADVPDLSVGYFYPTLDGWQGGDRTITCYVAKTDQSPVSTSLKGSAAQ